MAKNKPVGAGATVEVDLAQDGVLWNQVGCTTSITPPPQTKALIELTCQQDGISDHEPGIEELSQMEFIEPYDYQYGKTWIDDLYASAAEADWRLTFKRGTDFTLVIKFPGKVTSIVPGAAGGNDPLNRTVTVTRTGAIEHDPT